MKSAIQKIKLITMYFINIFSLSAAVVLMLSSMFLLSGCASMFNSAADIDSLSEQCQTSDQLYTDLTVSSDQRTYVLPDGQTCPRGVLS